MSTAVDTLLSSLTRLSRAHQLLSATDDSTGPRLRSGLYFVRMTLLSAEEEQLFIVYWPEDTTWNDNAISTIRKNRITFMRYAVALASGSSR